MSAQGSGVIEAREVFLEFLEKLDRDPRNGLPKARAMGSGVLPGQDVRLSDPEAYRRDCEGQLRYIEAESKIFSDLATRYRAALDQTKALLLAELAK